MRTYIFLKSAEKQFALFDKELQFKIIRKMDYYCKSENPLQYAKKLIHSELGSYRFRIGDYRIICDIDEKGKIIIIGIIGHRREVYT